MNSAPWAKLTTAEHAEDDRQSKRSDHQDRAERDPGKSCMMISSSKSIAQVFQVGVAQLAAAAQHVVGAPCRWREWRTDRCRLAMADFFLDSSTSTDCTDWWSHLR